MTDNFDFVALIQRIRDGDEQAAAELVQRYEPVVRREIRFRLEDPALSRLFDAEDVCQSVLASFFVRAAAGQYEVGEPAQLVGLLIGMARNKLAFAVRKLRTQRRDSRRQTDAAVEELGLADPAATPSRIVASRELLEHVQRRLSAEERLLADCRVQGLGWAQIAEQMGGTADGRRMQLTRALDRISRELGLDAADQE